MIGAIFVQFSQLILMKIIEIVATRCQILRLKCTKFDFGWGSDTDPARRAYSTRPGPLVGFKKPISKGREGKKGMDGPMPMSVSIAVSVFQLMQA